MTNITKKPPSFTFLLLIGMFMKTESIDCTWSDRKYTHGKRHEDDYTIDCVNGIITGIYRRRTTTEPIRRFSSSDGSVPCDWLGPRRMSGVNACDDFMFECYDRKLYGIKLVRGIGEHCPNAHFGPYGSSINGPVCNFNTIKRMSGAGAGDDFLLECEHGYLKKIHYIGRRRLDQGTSDILNNNENIFNEPILPVQNDLTCTTWATAEGRWQLIHQHSQNFKYEFTYGTKSSDTNARTDSWARSLEISIEKIFLFGTVTTKASFSNEVSKTVSHTFTKSYTQKTTVGCSDTNGDNTGGALYQWVFDAHHVGEDKVTTSIFTDTTICTKYQEEPTCPIKACNDVHCQTCSDVAWESTEALSDSGGFSVAECNWYGERIIYGISGRSDDYRFDCSKSGGKGQIAGIKRFKHTRQLRQQQQQKQDQRQLDVVTSCTPCDWAGPLDFAGKGHCDDFYFECYNGFLYGVTLVGHAIDFNDAELCTPNMPFDLAPPANTVLKGTQCNWKNIVSIPHHRNNDIIKVTCVDGLITDYFLIPG